MKHYGDITKLNGAELPVVDIITGGSPCQDLSVAGKRAGLAGERSGLFMEQIRVIKEMRENDRATGRTNDNIRPRYMVWENVPGAFSSNGGKDFHAVLEETAKVAKRDACIPEFDGKWPNAGCIMGDGWSIAWRVHDAQFWGVPQRRKRIALVADFGGQTAPEILFECKGVPGDFEESGETGETAAGDVAKSIGETGGAYTLKIRGGADTYIKSDGSIGTAGKGPLVQTELSGTLGVSQDQTLITCLNGWDVQSKHIQPEDGVAESLYAGECRGGGGESYVLQNQEPIVLDTNQNDASIHQDGKTNTLPASAGMGGGYVPMVCLNDQGGQQMGVTEDVSGTLRAQEHGHQPIVFEPGAASRLGGYCWENKAGTLRANAGDNQQAVVYGISSYDSNAMKSSNPNSGIYEAETARTLDLNGGSPACNQGGMAVVQSAGFDGYNQSIDIEVAQPLRAADGGDSTPKVIYLEGNGSRPSHQGDGYVESSTEHHAVCAEPIPINTMVGTRTTDETRTTFGIGHPGDPQFTLSSAHSHAVAYRKQGHPQNAEQGQGWEQTDVNDTLNAFDSGEMRTPTVVLENHPADSRVKIAEDGIVQTLSSRMGTGGGNVPMVMEGINGETAGTLDASYYKGCGERQGVEREVVCVGNGQLAQARLSDKVGALNCMHDQQAVMTYQDCTETVDACIGKGTSNQLANNDMFVANTSVVRRLTPMECERLQGYPDGWTNIGDWVDSKGKTHKGDSDSPRYKALGNSIALPFWEWMAKRMVQYLGGTPTMASLFSGIGGFELVFSRAGCEPVWASEIEEFPIAVTKIRFPEMQAESEG